MSELNGQPGELRITLTVTRKETGKVETFDLVGQATPEQYAAIMHSASGAMAGQGATDSRMGGSVVSPLDTPSTQVQEI